MPIISGQKAEVSDNCDSKSKKLRIGNRTADLFDLLNKAKSLPEIGLGKKSKAKELNQ
jgi:hypothetical protein